MEELNKKLQTWEYPITHWQFCIYFKKDNLVLTLADSTGGKIDHATASLTHSGLPGIPVHLLRF